MLKIICLYITRVLFCFGLCLTISIGWLNTAHAADPAARMRLLDGGREGTTYHAAVEITLQPGYLTYWRTPGEAGLSPVFDWDDSKNVSSVMVSWPAPERLLEADSVVYGFYKQVVLPLAITPLRPDEPVELKLRLQYGVCKDICIPQEAKATLTLMGSGDHAATVQRAIRMLPKKVTLGANEPFSILSIRKGSDDNTNIVTIKVPVPEGAALFAEGPEGSFYSTSNAQPGARAGEVDFIVRRESSSDKNHRSPSIRLTARSGTEAIETTTPLQ